MTTKQKSMPSIRAAAAREYSNHEETRLHYRNGFTEGWTAAIRSIIDAADNPTQTAHDIIKRITP